MKNNTTNTTLSEQFQIPIAKPISLTHKYMKAHFPGFMQALQCKVEDYTNFMDTQSGKKVLD